MMCTLSAKFINVYPRQRPTIAALLTIPVVQNQLKRRHLDHACIDDVEPAFHINCVAPKQLDGWNNIVQLFINLNATVVLDADEQSNMWPIFGTRDNRSTPS
jgi:hypothetical protein